MANLYDKYFVQLTFIDDLIFVTAPTNNDSLRLLVLVLEKCARKYPYIGQILALPLRDLALLLLRMPEVAGCCHFPSP